MNALPAEMKGLRPEWSNPHTEDGKLPEMPKNLHIYAAKGKVKKKHELPKLVCENVLFVG